MKNDAINRFGLLHPEAEKIIIASVEKDKKTGNFLFTFDEYIFDYMWYNSSGKWLETKRGEICSFLLGKVEKAVIENKYEILQSEGGVISLIYTPKANWYIVAVQKEKSNRDWEFGEIILDFNLKFVKYIKVDF